MFDLVLAIGLLMCLSIVGFSLGVRSNRSASCANLTALVVVALTLVFATCLHGRLSLALWIPCSSAIVLGNWLPLGAAVLAGVVRYQPNIPAWRRIVLSLGLLAAGWITVVWNTIPQDFVSINRYLNGVCLQSTPATCSACSAVTLLSHFGIEANEQEMSRLCLTSGRGTNLLGIYRGLRLKTNGSPYQVEIIQCEFDELKNEAQLPILIPVKQATTGSFIPVTSGNGLSIPLSQLLGRCDHCVILFEFTDHDTVKVGDPANFLFNPIERPVASLRRDWLGEGFRLVKRN